MDVTLFRLREKYDKFVLGLAIFLIALGIILLILCREYYFIDLIGNIIVQLGLIILVLDLFISKLGNQIQQAMYSHI